MQPIETIATGNGHTIEVYTDDDPTNPCTDWDMLGTISCQHDRYNLGHNQDSIASVLADYLADSPATNDTPAIRTIASSMIKRWGRDDYYEYRASPLDYVADNIDNMNATEQAELAAYLESVGHIFLPLSLYDHSGLTIWVGSPSCPWDSGYVGIVHASASKVKAEFNGDRDKAIACMKSEVETYDQYLRGDVYGFTITDTENDIEVESCWGVYGLNDCIAEAKACVPTRELMFHI
jgi:hypothetical protein